MDSYDGCPEDHPDCNAREERWEQIEEMIRKDQAELVALEQVLFEATVIPMQGNHHIKKYTFARDVV